MFQFTENQVFIPHEIVNVKNIYLLMKFVLEAVLVLFVKSDNTTGCQKSKLLRPRKCTCNLQR